MTLQEAIEILGAHRSELAATFGVVSLSIFGSYARNEARPDSDIDVLVTLDGRPFGLFDFARLRRTLSDLLGCEVDLATPEALHEAMKARILREAVRAA